MLINIGRVCLLRRTYQGMLQPLLCWSAASWPMELCQLCGGVSRHWGQRRLQQLRWQLYPQKPVHTKQRRVRHVCVYMHNRQTAALEIHWWKRSVTDAHSLERPAGGQGWPAGLFQGHKRPFSPRAAEPSQPAPTSVLLLILQVSQSKGAPMHVCCCECPG
jgi:hypothetical protein